MDGVSLRLARQGMPAAEPGIASSVAERAARATDADERMFALNEK